MHIWGELAALTAAILWSFTSFVFTEATKKINTYLLNLSRLFFAWVLLLITIPIAGINVSASSLQIIYLSLSGFIGLTLGDWFLFKAFKEIGPRISMLIMALNPAIAAIIAYFILDEKLSVLGIIGIVVTISGIAMVVLHEKDDDEKRFKISRMGIIFGVLAAIGQGVGLIFSKMAYQSGEIHTLTATFIRIFSAYLLLLPIGYITKMHSHPIKIFLNDKKLLWWVILGSIIGPYLGITLSFIAVIYTHVGVAATLLSTSPILILPMSHYIYHERLSWKSVLGAFIAVIGIFILFLY